MPRGLAPHPHVHVVEAGYPPISAPIDIASYVLSQSGMPDPRSGIWRIASRKASAKSKEFADLALSGGTMGFLMLRIAVLRMGALGRWGAPPLLLGLVMIPQPGFLLPSFLKDVPLDMVLLLDLISGLGWMLLGFLTAYSASYRSAAHDGARPAEA